MESGFVFRKFLLFFGDLFLFLSALIITLIFGFGKDFNWSIFLQHLYPFSFLLIVWLFFFVLIEGYNLWTLKDIFSLAGKIFVLFVLIIVSSSLFFYLFKNFQISPKQNLVVFAIIFCAFLFLWRKFIFCLYSKHFQQKVAILGINSCAEKLANCLKENPQIGWHFVGFLNKKILEKIVKSKERLNFDILILAEKTSLVKKREKALFDLFSLKVEILNLANAYEQIFKKIPVEFINSSWFIENLKEGKKEFFDKTKRITDVFFATFLLLFTSPLFPIIALAIKLEDKGPIFYKQTRVGKNKKLFSLIKFRSMVPDAEKKKPIWARKHDPRITKVGRFLRRTHLDEIPQMINIIKGDISLVGPRPERPEFVEKLEKEIPYYHLRHIIKPGFTGWAQIKFRYARSVIDSLEKFEYDLYYIKNRSFLLDFYILLKTLGLFLKE
ncbi:MAG: sugar transferase [Candidatus Pacebacteria bacterium]|nr:sugar transferase [Candidatus Paceibacterota bacterium]